MSLLDTSALTLRFRGVRGSIPAPGFDTARYGGNTACVELRCGEEILILDAGTGIRSLGRDLAVQYGSRSIAASLLISHTHWDHIQGLPFFSPLYAPQNRIRVIAAEGSASTLEQILRNQMQATHFPVVLDEMRGLVGFAHLEAEHTWLGKFRIGRMGLNHPGGCAGLRISANGASIAYLPDHEPYRHSRNGNSGGKSPTPREALVDFIQGADLLILDTQYTELEYLEHIGWGHGCLTDSVALAIDAGVGRLLLFHHDPSRPDDQVDEMVTAARALVGASRLVIDAAAEDQTITLGSSAENRDSNGRFQQEVDEAAVGPIFATAARRKVSFRRSLENPPIIRFAS